MGFIEKAENLPELFFLRTNKWEDKALAYVFRNGSWQKQSWKESAERIVGIAQFLESKGLAAGDRLAILSESRYEWLLVDLAAQLLGAIVVPVYPTLVSQDILEILNDAQPKILVYENFFQAGKIEAIYENLEVKATLISLTASEEHGAKRGLFLDCFKKVNFSESLGFWETKLANLKKASAPVLASVVYTSGTAGRYKGASLSHQNFLTVLKSIETEFPLGSEDSTLLFLPQSHILARIEGYLPLAVGSATAYAQSSSTVQEDLLTFKPTVFFAVPRFYESLRNRILGKIDKKINYQKYFLKGLLQVSKHQSRLKQRSKSPSLLETVAQKVGDEVFFSKVRDRLGGRIRFLVSGGAPLDSRVAEFFHGMGLLVLEGYGLSETTGPIFVNRPDAFKFGSVGKSLGTVDLHLTAEGEICFKGPAVMVGYWDKSSLKALTQSVEPSFASGDIGHLDSRGFLHITDRKKDILVLSNGKKVAPQKIEALLCSDPWIRSAIALGESEAFVGALLVLNWDEVSKEENFAGMNPENLQDLGLRHRLESMLKRRIEVLNQKLPPFEAVKRFSILKKDLSIEAGELTPTLKVRRNYVIARYKKAVDEIYNRTSSSENVKSPLKQASVESIPRPSNLKERQESMGPIKAKDFFNKVFNQKISENPSLLKSSGLKEKNIYLELIGSEGGKWEFVFNQEGSLKFAEVGSVPSSSDCFIEMKTDVFEGLMKGTVNVAMAVMTRKIKVKGDVGLAGRVGQALRSVF